MQILHLMGPGPFCANSFVVVSEAGSAAIIDPAASPEEYNDLLEQCGGAKLKLMLCTHGHMDHVGGAAALQKQWDCLLYCEPCDVQGDELYPLRDSDGGYVEGGVIKMDEVEFRVWHTPGHSEGSVCILCGEYLFTGDTLFHGDTGRTDLSGGSGAVMAATCRKLKTLPIPPETKVLPGHAEFTTFGDEMENNWCVRAMLRGEEV